MNSFCVPDNCSNKIFNRDWLLEIWNVMKLLPEPEVHQHNLAGDPMCGQPCRMTSSCGNEISYHNSTPTPTANEKAFEFIWPFSTVSSSSWAVFFFPHDISTRPAAISPRIRFSKWFQLDATMLTADGLHLRLFNWTQLTVTRHHGWISKMPISTKPGNHYILHHLGLLPHAQEQTDHGRLSSETNEILEGDGGHNEPTRIRIDGVHTTSTSRKQSGHSDKSSFQQGFSPYGSPQRPTRSITRFPTSKTPERPTPPDLSC